MGRDIERLNINQDLAIEVFASLIFIICNYAWKQRIILEFVWCLKGNMKMILKGELIECFFSQKEIFAFLCSFRGN